MPEPLAASKGVLPLSGAFHVLSNTHGNLVLASLADDYALLEPHLAPVTLRVRQCLESTNRPINTIYFPYRGIASVVAVSKGRRCAAEVALIGWEGMTGLAVVLGLDTAPTSTFVQIAGDGQSIAADRLRQLMAVSRSLRDVLLRFAHMFAIQAAYMALANAHGTLNQRLARWLLMAHDRLLEDELHFTHEFLASVLGVRRAGITIALHHLQVSGLISTSRRTICILNRIGLEGAAAGFYGGPEDELERLFPLAIKPARHSSLDVGAHSLMTSSTA